MCLDSQRCYRTHLGYASELDHLQLLLIVLEVSVRQCMSRYVASRLEDRLYDIFLGFDRQLPR